MRAINGPNDQRFGAGYQPFLYLNIAPRAKHLQRYVEEQVFRFNERENTDGPRFNLAAKGADGKRLTYKTLTA